MDDVHDLESANPIDLFRQWLAEAERSEPNDANAAALAKGSEEFTVELAGKTWTQKPQKYHAKSLSANAASIIRCASAFSSSPPSSA